MFLSVFRVRIVEAALFLLGVYHPGGGLGAKYDAVLVQRQVSLG